MVGKFIKVKFDAQGVLDKISVKMRGNRGTFYRGKLRAYDAQAEWCSLVDVRWFCEQRWLFVGDSFDGPEARGNVEVISKAFIPYACHVYGYGLLNCVTL
jgi:hypothetical protein